MLKHCLLYVSIHVKSVEKKFFESNVSSTEYEENLYESQESFVVENTDTDIDELIDLISNLHLYCYEPEKDASKSSTSDSDTNEEY